MKKNRSHFLWTLGAATLNSLIIFFIFNFFFKPLVGIIFALVAFFLAIWIMAALKANKV